MPLLRYEVWLRCELDDKPDPEHPEQTVRVADLFGLLMRHAKQERADMRARQVAQVKGEAFVHDRKTGSVRRYEKAQPRWTWEGWRR